METLVVNNPPVIIGDKQIAEFNVKPINLTAFTKLAEETNNIGAADNKEWQLHNKRLRMKYQISAIATDGSAVKLDDLSITQLPRTYGVKLSNMLSEGQGTPGEIISGENDGVSAPILYRLGTPIKMQQNGDEIAITELEFQASTFGQIEDVLAETNPLSQTVSMLSSIAKPVGMETLQALPSWALDKVTMADGFTISEKVLPRFLE